MKAATPRHGKFFLLALIAAGALVASPARSQPTVGLLVNDAPAEGLTLFSPNASTSTYLIHNDGLVVRRWTSGFRPALMGYLLPNGHLLRTTRLGNQHPNFAGNNGGGGRLEQYDWDGNLVWEFQYSSASVLAHHDVEPMPNGNVLMIAWEYMTAAEAIAAGKNPALVADGLWIDSVIEVRPTPPVGGEIVWIWRARDHLIQDFDPTKANFGAVGNHPELIDFNWGGANKDWTHINAISYDPELDQIVLSAPRMAEVWVLDHSTTTAEAAGHTGGAHGKGGDLLYRWGNPRVYRRGTLATQKLFGQHDAQWVPPGRPGAGNILIFNNGSTRPGGPYSTVEEIAPPLDADGRYPSLPPGVAYGPEQPVWRYVGDPPASFYSVNISGADRQRNGNTLICEGARGHLFEVRPDHALVWDYVNPVNASGPLPQGATPTGVEVFKVRRYPLDFPGFAGRDLTPGDPVEQFSRPFPVPRGSLTAARMTEDGTRLEVRWDASGCPSFDYNLLYGSLGSVSTYGLAGASCGIGAGGAFFWADVPAGDLFFLVVGTDASRIYESSWGRDAAGVERLGTKASFRCGATTKVVTSVCL